MFPLFDAHCDTPSYLLSHRVHLRNSHGDVTFTGLHSIQPHARFFAYWKYAYPLIHSYFSHELTQNADGLALCRTGQDARRAFAEGKTACFLAIEGADVFRCNEAAFQDAFEAGVRMLSLTWNGDNAFSGGVTHPSTGLSQRGKRFCTRVATWPLLLDVSHLSDRGFSDLAGLLPERTLVASHSNARARCSHKRNLTDEQFAHIIKVKGFAGINLHAPFLSETEAATWDDVVAHIEHFLSLGGEGHVGLGCDLDGGIRPPRGYRTLKDLGVLYETLLRRNYSEALIQDIFFNNILKVVDRVCGM